ncbi:MAG: GntR family transcriptional regulator [Deltaproteobacteria bacterium]|nr:GntR family transcriptional regulator [Deltaproteobacteria bacterium]
MVKLTDSKKETVFQALRDKIIMSEYPPGTILTEKILGQEFGITRTTLKEIIYRLEEMSLVELIPRVGIKVTEIDYNALIKDYEVMIYLEKMAATLAARHMTADKIKQIGDLIDQMETSFDDHLKNVQQDHLLHKLVHEDCRNPTLIQFLESLLSRALRMVNALLIFSDPEMVAEKLGMTELKEFHKMLVERKDEKAGFYFAEHSKKYLNAIRKKLSSESYL